MSAYFWPVFDEALALANEGIEVRPLERKRDANGNVVIVEGEPFRHKAFLIWFEADSPGRVILARWLAHMALKGCGYCDFIGVRYKGEGFVIRFPGYSVEVQQYGHLAGQEVLANDPRLALTHDDHVRK